MLIFPNIDPINKYFIGGKIFFVNTCNYEKKLKYGVEYNFMEITESSRINFHNGFGKVCVGKWCRA